MTEGRKDDQDKLPYHLIAPELLEDVAKVLDFGQRKYAPRNWEAGMAWHRPFAALMRHMWAWWRGAGVDDETGLSHLAHAACCIMFLLAYEKRKIGEDDRPPFWVQRGPEPNPAPRDDEKFGAGPQERAECDCLNPPHCARFGCLARANADTPLG